MKTEIKILRRGRGEKESYWQTFFYDAKEKTVTIAAVLQQINEREELTDSLGRRAASIKWECGCLQKKCGACAMVVDGMPVLACEEQLNGRHLVEIKPLQKFPVEEDLIVNREEMFQNLEKLKVWLEHKKTKDAASFCKVMDEEQWPDAFEASRCLQCGCCLEICTSFVPNGEFMGMSALVPVSRILSEAGETEQEYLRDGYIKHIYEGCENFYACQHVCPAGIDLQHLMAHSNAAVFLDKEELGR